MPEWKLEIRRRLAGLQLAPTREASIIEELSQHLDDCYEALLSSGATPADAYQQTLAELSESEIFEGELRRVERQAAPEPIVLGTNRRTNMIGDLWQDLRYGVRMLVKQPSFTCVAVLTLALGIGANTAIFSLIDAALLKLLPVEQPEQLFFVNNAGARGGGGAPQYPCFERFRDHNHYLSGIAAFNQIGPKLTIDGQTEQVKGQFVSGNYFSLLGVKAIIGRTFNPSDDSVIGQGGPDGPVAVISYNYWQRRFALSPAVIGKVVQTGKTPVTIIGVTPPEFFGLTLAVWWTSVCR